MVYKKIDKSLVFIAVEISMSVDVKYKCEKNIRNIQKERILC